jgi:putative flippase GtrA
MARHWRNLRTNPLFGQLVRYAVTGGGVTLLGGALYTGIVMATTIHPQVAMIAAYLVCVAVGYWLHSRWSFRGHGGERDTGTTVRFFAVSLVSYGLNAFFTWFCIDVLGLPEWTPVLPLLFVTPLATFALNRAWVFR